MAKDVEEVVDEDSENSEARIGEVDGNDVAFSATEQTGNNAISNLGDEDDLKKIEDEEAQNNQENEAEEDDSAETE